MTKLVGITGGIGSGKTTIEKLIMGLYTPSEGAVKIDGLDLNQLNPFNLRNNIGYVPQDIDLLHGTVKDNIVLKAPYVHSSEIIRVAKVAGVSQFVNKHPSGFDMKIGERLKKYVFIFISVLTDCNNVIVLDKIIIIKLKNQTISYILHI